MLRRSRHSRYIGGHSFGLFSLALQRREESIGTVLKK